MQQLHQTTSTGNHDPDGHPSQTLDFAASPELISKAISGSGFIEKTENGVAACHLPKWARQRSNSAWLDVLARCNTGVTLNFKTRASVVELDLLLTRYVFEGTLEPAVVVIEAQGTKFWFDIPSEDGVLVQGDAASGILDTPPSTDTKSGSTTTIRAVFPGASADRHLVVRMPQSAAVEVVGVRSDAPLRVEKEQSGPSVRWLHHGSSISHGTNVPDPEAPWPNQAAKALNVNVINASFSGNAILDPFAADALSELELDIASLEVGINIVNWDSHIARSFVPALHGFLDRFRWQHPDLPLVLITPFYCGFHETAAGPIERREDGRLSGSRNPRTNALTLTSVRRLIATVVELRADPLLYTVDGLTLLGASDEHLLDDGLHPGEAGTRLIADRFVALAQDAGSSLGRAFAAAKRSAG